MLAVVAYIPSAAAFTPAILGSLAAAIGALVAARMGARRLAVLSFYFIGATVVISPVFWNIDAFVRSDYLMVVLAAIGLVVAGMLWRNHRRAPSGT
ncbi:MAG: hypothetical protein IIC61_07100 [Proteobacteria bacterium]|nr:hypothetical protein [Pseudomonadota bacterium]TDJ35738.1 MAG: hypothetical protein E2O53_05460 [Gammaproteobacteria bacterium]